MNGLKSNNFALHMLPLIETAVVITNFMTLEITYNIKCYTM